MIKEAIAKGNTLEEAKEKAIAELNAGEGEDIQFEIITTPKKKVLGLFGGAMAEVRVFVELPDEKPAKKRNEKPKSEKKHNEKKQNNEKKAEPQAEKKAKPQEEVKPSVSDDYKNAVDADTISADTPAGRAVAYIRTILKGLGCENVSIKVAEKENGAFIVLEGEGLGVIIGHRGETLDALQYLAGLSANSGGGYYKVSLNIGNYREKREQTLTALATRVAEQVLRTGRSRSLEPMNPYERRIIHTAVQEIEGVVSNSIGEGSSRRVVIAPEGGDTRPPRRDGNRSRNRARGGRGNGRPNNTVATAPSREPKKDSDIPLYGKIN